MACALDMGNLIEDSAAARNYPSTSHHGRPRVKPGNDPAIVKKMPASSAGMMRQEVANFRHSLLATARQAYKNPENPLGANP
jgi:hypothetical protein